MLGQEGQHRVHIRSNSVPEWPHARDCRTCHTRKPVRFVQPASPMPVGLECLEKSVEAVAPWPCKCSTPRIFAKVVALERVWGPGCLVEKQVCLTGSSGDTGVASQATGESINWHQPAKSPSLPASSRRTCCSLTCLTSSSGRLIHNYKTAWEEDSSYHMEQKQFGNHQ